MFKYVPTSTCILYVPIESKDLYAKASQWKDFINIEEIPVTGIEEISVDGASGQAAPYYDLSGRRVANPTRGIYIQKGKKVLVK